jgi:hypothetical protein
MYADRGRIICFAQSWERQPHMAKRRAALRICLELGYQCDTRLGSGNLLQDTSSVCHPTATGPLPPCVQHHSASSHFHPRLLLQKNRMQPGSRQQPTAQPRTQPQTQARPVSYATTAPACILYACGVCEPGGTYEWSLSLHCYSAVRPVTLGV